MNPLNNRKPGLTGRPLIYGLLSLSGALLMACPGLAQTAPTPGIAPPPLSETPYQFDTAEVHGITVSLVAKLDARPFAFTFLPGGDLLVTERGGNLRIVRDATSAKASLDPAPVKGMPPIDAETKLGLLDVALDPDFERNHRFYFTWVAAEPGAKPAPGAQPEARLRVMRGTLIDGQVSDVETLIEGSPSYPAGSRVRATKDGTIWVSTGAPFGDAAQDLGSIYGKILRLNADGSIPKDNPFVGRPGSNPAIYSYGHRDQHGLVILPVTGQIIAAEHGPNGGDEANLIVPGGNYGWPSYSFGRNYDGSAMTEFPSADGIERPLLVWLPSIAPSGLMVYEGDRFPAWKGNLFIGSGRRGEINGTGGLERVAFDDKLGELRRETLLTQLHKRVRDVTQGPDGNIYVLTDGDEFAVLRIAPAG